MRQPIQPNLDLGLAQQEAHAVFLKALFKDVEKETTLGDLLRRLLPTAVLSEEDLSDSEIDNPTRTAIRSILGIRVDQVQIDKKPPRKKRKPRTTPNKDDDKEGSK